MRAHTAYVGFDLYGIIIAIHTDNESAWAEECANFTEIIEGEGGLDMIYSDPGVRNMLLGKVVGQKGKIRSQKQGSNPCCMRKTCHRVGSSEP